MATKSLCSVPDCGKTVTKREWCELHYRRWLRHGDATSGRELNGEPQRYLRDVAFVYDGTECLTWPFSCHTDGRGKIYYEGRMQTVHRLVCKEANGPPPSPDHEAAHSCGKGHLACVAKRHLSWKTNLENKADELIHGTRARGETHGMVKLTEADVVAIRALKGKLLHREIAAQFGVSKPLISMILAGKSWGWL
jgi:hypothetical protein